MPLSVRPTVSQLVPAGTENRGAGRELEGKGEWAKV